MEEKLTNKQLIPYILLGLVIFGGFVVLGVKYLAIIVIS
jgi:hypothetical protein